MRILSALVLFYWSVLLSLDAHAQSLDISEIAPGVYVHYGRQEDSFPYNRGDISNMGFIVGERGVAVIDTGGSPYLGGKLREAVRAVTSLPIVYVINTHVHPDHIFGNVAFIDPATKFVGNSLLSPAMQARGPYYLNKLPRDVGGGDAENARMVPPDIAVEDTLTLDLGGRTLRLKSCPTSSTWNKPATKGYQLNVLITVAGRGGKS